MTYQGEAKNSGELVFSRDEFETKWVLYGHKINNESDWFFIGICQLKDLYDFGDAFRNSLWSKTVKGDTPIAVKVLASADQKALLYDAVKLAYDDLRPRANVNGHLLVRQTVVTCVIGQNIGQTYSTAAAAAKHNGISPGAMSNHLNGLRGYDNIRGMKFKRGL